MKIRDILLIVVSCVVTATVFGQSTRFVGKWGTDGAATRAAMTVMLDLKVDARNNVTGSITQYAVALCGAPDTRLRIDSGTLVGKVLTFVTTVPTSCPTAGTATASRDSGTQVTWTGTLGDDDSLSFPSAVAGARGAGGSPGAGAAPGGGAPAAGGSRNPLGTPANPLPRGGNVAPQGSSAGGAPGAGSAPSFPPMVMHRLQQTGTENS
jgi:hypothetical protein